MYLNVTSSGYDKDGSQWSRGAFLWVVLPNEPEEVPCLDCGQTSTAPIDGGVKWSCQSCGIEFYPWFSSPPFTLARAFVRHVHMKQCGHWMMGTIKVGKHEQTVSGAYGSDGLPDDADRKVWEAGVPVPESIMEKWAKSESGHNGPGDEYHDVRRWANDNINALRRAGRSL